MSAAKVEVSGKKERYFLKVLFVNRVTRLGEFPPIGRLFSLGTRENFSPYTYVC
jgi:hypothetical protein